MSKTNPDRLASTELDADLSVLGDDANAEPKVPRIGDTPEPRNHEELRQAAKPDDEAPATGSSEGLDQQRAEKEAMRDVVDGYGKG